MAGGAEKKIPKPVLEKARRLALDAADGDGPERVASPDRQRRIKEKVVAALKKLHPMD